MTPIIFALSFAWTTLLSLVRDPIYGLYLYIAIFFLHPPSRWWGQSLPDLRWSFLAAAITAVAILLHSSKKTDKPVSSRWYATGPGMLMIILILYMWIQSLWAISPIDHTSAAVQYSKYVLVFAFVYTLAYSPERMTNVLLVIIAGCTYLGYLTNIATASSFANGRINGVGGPGISDANTLSMMFAVGVACAAVLALSSSGWRRIVAILTLPLMLNGLILAGSRGAFLALLAGGIFLVFAKPPRLKAKFWLFAIVGVLTVSALIDQRFMDRLVSISTLSESDTEEVEKSARSRIYLQKAQLQMAVRFPHGAGHKGTAALSPYYLDRRFLTGGDEENGVPAQRSSHNTFLTLLVEQGLLGALLYAAAIVWVLRTAKQLIGLQSKGLISPEDAQPAIASLCGLTIVFVAGIFTDYFMAEVQIWLFAIAAASKEYVFRLKAKPGKSASESKAIPSRRTKGLSSRKVGNV